MRVIGYTYEADHHCITCTKKRFDEGGFKINTTTSGLEDNPDEHGVSYAACDNEGNPIHPIMSTDELPCDLPEKDGGYNPVACGDCGNVIRARRCSL